MPAASHISAPRIVLTGGGTGGHVYPALAVAAALGELKPRARLFFVGGDRLEARLAPAAGLPFRRISVHGLVGRGLSQAPRRARALAELALGLPLLQSLAALRRFRPQLVIGTGGYVSGPVLLAARLLRVPCLALEGNCAPGWTTCAVARMVDAIAVAHSEMAEFFACRVRKGARVVITGLPVRQQIVTLSRETGATALGLDPALTTLLALGGSLGSRRMNEALVGALNLLGRSPARLDAVQVLHVTGERYAQPSTQRECEFLPPNYRSIAYLGSRYPESLAAADLVISRAGASTLAELTARGVPAVLIPWSGAAAGEQDLNAAPLARAGAAIVIPDRELGAERLARTLDELLGNNEKLERMARASRALGKPRAARDVAALALQLAERRTPA